MTTPTLAAQRPFPGHQHNHDTCASTALVRAEQAFEANGLKLTDLRRRVLGEILSSHQAIGAYDILERLARSGPRLAPISVYRAIDALLEARVIHRLESRNAYFACLADHPGGGDRDMLILVCDSCGRVAEVSSAAMLDAIGAAAKEAAFAPRRIVTEVTGQCRDCSAART